MRKVAIVHDWLTGMRGGERCLEVFCELFPQADLYTLLHVRGRVSRTIEGMRIQTSFVQHLPFAGRRYRAYLPLFPTAVEQFDLRGYDLVLSSSHCVAKGVITPPETCHIAYIHSPMRYIWDLYPDYFGRGRVGWFASTMVPLLANYLRMWDVASSYRVDYFIANSRHVAGKIRKYYGREAEVIYPPVNTDLFKPLGLSEDGHYYLVVSAFVPYKRIDLAIQAFNRLKLPLRIVGWGPEEGRLKKLAGPTVEFLGKRSDEELSRLYARCRALIFPGEEDFGIVPLEAQASGRPVIAYAKGGVLETVIPLNPQGLGVRGQGSVDSHHLISNTRHPPPDTHHPTGVFFYEQTIEALVQAVRVFEANHHRFEPKHLRDHALQFDRVLFKARILRFIEERWEEFQRHRQPVF